MKKFFGVIVAVMLCVCMLVPTAVAADTTDDAMATLTELLGGVDLGSLNSEEITNILSGLDLEGLDIEGLIAEFEGEDSNEAVDTLDAMLQQLNSVQADNSGNGTTSAVAAIGGYDIGAIIQLIPGDFDKDAITGVLGSLTEGGFSSLLGSIGTAFSGKGINLASYDEVGTFDIATVSTAAEDSGNKGTQDLASSATDLTAGLADTLMSALKGLGIDSATIEKLLGNDIVNFFANMYIGFIGDVEETTTKASEPTTEPPKTGDTSAVFVALATLTVASGAAFVCLKKKEEE